MTAERITIGNIPALVWGGKSEKAYIYVHGKESSKESAKAFAEIAENKGFQTVSFDLPQHGERKDASERCNIWSGMRDLAVIGEYVFDNWQSVSLFACSLGAYFSLHTYHDCKIEKCLFLSPVLDMEYLVGKMMLWFQVSEERLAQEKEIDTPVDLMSWEYYQFIKTHPVRNWDVPTSILFGGRDAFQSEDVVRDFAGKFGCVLTVAEDSEHPFGTDKDSQIIERWLRDTI